MGSFSNLLSKAEGIHGCSDMERVVGDWVYAQAERFQGADERVLYFIGWIRFHEGVNPGEGIVEHLFACGYCYYFALMLKDAFGRGVVCCNGRSHILWLDGTNPNTDIAYDINGVNYNYEVLIPVKAMGNTLYGFKHVPGLYYETTQEEVTYLTNLFKNADDLGGYV